MADEIKIRLHYTSSFYINNFFRYSNDIFKKRNNQKKTINQFLSKQETKKRLSNYSKIIQKFLNNSNKFK